MSVLGQKQTLAPQETVSAMGSSAVTSIPTTAIE